MLRLMTVLATFGLLIGGLAAMVERWTYRLVPVSDFGWFAYTPLGGGTAVAVIPTWWAGLIVLPAGGLLLGALAGWAVAAAGWRLTRSGRGQRGGSPDDHPDQT